MDNGNKTTAYFHLPGLFEFYELYKKFLPLFVKRREYFYDWCKIASIYGAPSDCVWGGGRVEESNVSAEDVLSLTQKYGVSARLTFSNFLLSNEDLQNERCNRLASAFAQSKGVQNGVIVSSDLLLHYLKNTYPNLYFVSSTT